MVGCAFRKRVYDKTGTFLFRGKGNVAKQKVRRNKRRMVTAREHTRRNKHSPGNAKTWRPQPRRLLKQKTSRAEDRARTAAAAATASAAADAANAALAESLSGFAEELRSSRAGRNGQYRDWLTERVVAYLKKEF
jgi:hypothetical protein